MALFTLWEIIQAIVMTVVVGWIFKDVFAPKGTPEQMMKKTKKDDWLFAALLVAPAIILHELGHKFVAMGFGLDATFNAAWMWLGLGIIMKLIGGFIFFVPAFVSISGTAPIWVFGLAALAGPAVNFALYGLAKLAPIWRKQYIGHRIKKKELVYWLLFARINLFLGVFNLIPIPGFDGFQVIRSIFMLFSG